VDWENWDDKNSVEILNEIVERSTTEFDDNQIAELVDLVEDRDPRLFSLAKKKILSFLVLGGRKIEFA
jgi:hypothetical protein